MAAVDNRAINIQKTLFLIVDILLDEWSAVVRSMRGPLVCLFVRPAANQWLLECSELLLLLLMLLLFLFLPAATDTSNCTVAASVSLLPLLLRRFVVTSPHGPLRVSLAYTSTS